MKLVSKCGLLCVAVAVVALSCGVAGGATMIILKQDDFNTDLDGWQAKSSPGEGAAYGAISQNPNLAGQAALQITNQFAGAVEDFIYGPSDLGGDWVDFEGTGYAVKQVLLDFYAGGTTGGGTVDYPSALELYFLTQEGPDEYYWRYTIDVSSLSSGWNELTVAVDGYGWYVPGDPTKTFNDFKIDVYDVDEVGLLLTYQSWAGQVYGIDDFTLGYAVPEPSTYAVLAFAFLSVGFTFRRKLSDTLSNLKKR